MRFLADESCDFRVVRTLRNSGYDVACVAESAAGLPDEAVAAWAVRDERVLITEDRDFGQLARASSKLSVTVLLLRFPHAARSNAPMAVLEVIRTHGTRIAGRFVVVQPGRIRIT